MYMKKLAPHTCSKTQLELWCVIFVELSKVYHHFIAV